MGGNSLQRLVFLGGGDTSAALVALFAVGG
jgi:hypothetical protein